MSSGLTRKYDPANIVMTVGTRTVTGWVKGSFLEIERYAEATELDVGTDGETTLIVSQNRSGYYKFTLQQSSPLNDYFSALALAMEQRNTAQGVVSILVEDLNGSTVCQSKQNWVKKKAKISFEDKASGREWTFDTGYLDVLVGGEQTL